MLGEILLGVFGNGIYDIIKNVLKDVFHDDDDDLIQKVYCVLEETSKNFFDKYGDEFGIPSSSFLARQSNIDCIVKSLFYGNNYDLQKVLSVKGFDGTKDVTEDALNYFISTLYDNMLRDFRLSKILIEKNHIFQSQETSNKIIDMLNKLANQGQTSDKKDEETFKGWTMKDSYGNESPVIEGKSYTFKFPNGAEATYMFKDGLIYVDFIDIHGQKSYYELDINGNLKDTRFPYELSEYSLIIPGDQIVHKQIMHLPNGLRREVIKLKWGKQADVIFDSRNKLVNINLHGGWEVRHKEKLIVPKYEK
jgi:hypothetical protein